MTSIQIRLACLAAAFAIAIAELLWTTPYETTGVLESAAIDGERVSVTLREGPKITATVSYGGPLAAGDSVHVMVRRRLVGYTDYYYVTGRDNPSPLTHARDY